MLSHQLTHPDLLNILDNGDIDPILLRIIYKPQSRNPIFVSTSIKGHRRHSQFDLSLLLPKPCKHSQPESSLPLPNPLTIPALESLGTLSEKYPSSDIDSPTFSHVSLLLNQPLNIPPPI